MNLLCIFFYFLVWTWVTTGYCTKNGMLEIPGPKILTANSSTTSSYMANLWYPTNRWWVFTGSRIWQAVFLHQNHQPPGRWLTQSLRLQLYFDHHLVLSSAKIDVCLVWYGWISLFENNYWQTKNIEHIF